MNTAKTTEQTRFRGSGYAWILTKYHDGRPFTVAEVHDGMKRAGLISDTKCGFRRASDCITRMQKTSKAGDIKVNYQNWIGCLQYFGKSTEGEHLYCVTSKGSMLGKKIVAAQQAGVNLRSHHLAKRVDKQFKVEIPKRGYFRTKKVYDPLARTKAVVNSRRTSR